MAGKSEGIYRKGSGIIVKMKLADQYMETIAALKELARELRIRNPAKLLQAARGRVAGASLRLAKLALEDYVSKKLLAPKYRSTSKSTAEGPNERLQGDLLDYDQNTKTHKREISFNALRCVHA